MHKIFTSLVLTLLISGCSVNTGHQFLSKMTHAQIASNLTKGKTTKGEAQVTFGDPEDVILNDDGSEIWIYKYVRSEAKGVNYVPIVNSFYSGTNDNIKKLKIKFNSQGIVQNIAFSSAKGETKAGLFQ